MRLLQLDAIPLFRADSLSWLMAGLVLFVIVNVMSYSKRYLSGDKFLTKYCWRVLFLTVSVLGMIFTDHLLVFLVSWIVTNGLLVRLMIHKSSWIAARNAGLLALKSLGIGIGFLVLGLFLLAEHCGSASISHILEISDGSSDILFAALLLIAMAAMVQSAVWPFHRWLLSSLNSPTPVSALMHAGIINAGGFLLVRFAPLFIHQTLLMQGLFLIGLVTVFLGTFWKLIQTDIKRMLACSTMGQMGFMFMQCGMGLFAHAISHLCWHGLFKAYLFLNAGSVVKESRSSLIGFGKEAPTPIRFLLACIAGFGGVIAFQWMSGGHHRFSDTSCLMLGLSFMAATQLAVGLLVKPINFLRLSMAWILGTSAGGLYGLSIYLVESVLESFHLTQPQPLSVVYLLGFGLILTVWLGTMFNIPFQFQSSRLWRRCYVAALNASQPHPQTITSNRTTYQS